MKHLYRFLVLCGGLMVQWWCFTYLAPWGLSPQILLLLTVTIASIVGPVAGQTFAFFWGLFLDAMSPHLFGANTLALTLVGYVVGNARRQMDVSSPASQALLAFVASYVYMLFIVLIGLIFRGQPLWGGWLAFLITPFLNGAVAPLGYVIVWRYMDL